jgi:hypothetical protein
MLAIAGRPINAIDLIRDGAPNALWHASVRVGLEVEERGAGPIGCSPELWARCPAAASLQSDRRTARRELGNAMILCNTGHAAKYARATCVTIPF